MLKQNKRFVVFTVAVIAILIVSSILPASAQLSQWRSLNPTRLGNPALLPGPFLYSVQMLGPNYGWAVGGTCNIYAVLPAGACVGFALFWDGVRWRNVLVPATAGTLASVFIVSQNDVWAVGDNGQLQYWNGAAWSRVSAPYPDLGGRFNGVAAASASDVWAVGYYDQNATYQLLTWIDHYTVP
jgi:hypothetical protein